jgi:hypothetical protein
MKFILSTGLTLAATTFLSAMPATAQEAELKALELQSAVNDIVAGKNARTEMADLDQDGFLEAMVVYEDEVSVAGALFSIVDEVTPGVYDEVAFQFGSNPTLVSEGTVIDANGVYFNWTGIALLPYFDIYETLQFYDGAASDRLSILEVDPWMENLRHYDIKIANVDLFGDETPERFAWLDGSEYVVAQATPYYVFDSEGTVVTSGAFIDRPYLFNLADRKAAALITYNGAGFETKILE